MMCRVFNIMERYQSVGRSIARFVFEILVTIAIYIHTTFNGMKCAMYVLNIEARI